jgi:hypothetical protein
MDGSKGGGGCLTKIRLPVQQLESAREEGLVTEGATRWGYASSLVGCCCWRLLAKAGGRLEGCIGLGGCSKGSRDC